MPAAPRPRAKPSRFDAIEMLKADHIAIKKLFIAFHQLSDRSNTEGERRAVAERLCLELTVHGQIEEEIFYPAVRAAIGEDALIDQAEVEHASARELIAEISAMKPSDEQFDAKVIVLAKHIDAHVEEEHAQIFPKAKKAKMDLKALGSRLASRKAKLVEEYQAMQSGGEAQEDEAEDPVGHPPRETSQHPVSRA